MKTDKLEEIHIRGLNKTQVMKLEGLSKTLGFESRNQLIITLIQDFLEENNNEFGETFGGVYLKEILKTNQILIEKLNLREKYLNSLEQRTIKMADKLSNIVEQI